MKTLWGLLVLGWAGASCVNEVSTAPPPPGPTSLVFTVDHRGDAAPPGRMTLRGALAAAAMNAGADEIRFDPAVFTDTSSQAIPPGVDPWAAAGQGDRILGEGAFVVLGRGIVTEGAEVSGLRFESTAEAAVTIRGGAPALIAEIEVRGGAGGILILDDGPVVAIRDVRVFGGSGAGVEIRGAARVSMTRVELAHNAGPGVTMPETASLDLRWSRIANNSSHGVAVPPPALINPACEGGLLHGIGRLGERDLAIRNSVIDRNGGFGLWIADEGIRGFVESSTISGSGQDGVRMEGNSRAVLSEAFIHDNAGHGSSAFNAVLDIERVSITRNGGLALELGQNYCQYPFPSSPAVTRAGGRITGRADPGATVALYEDDAEELGHFLAEVPTTVTGDFTWEGPIRAARVNAVARWTRSEVSLSSKP